MNLNICGFKYYTDTVHLAIDRGGVAVQSMKLKQKLCALRCRYFTFQITTNIIFVKEDYYV